MELISVLFILSLLVTFFWIGGKGNPIHSDSKELVCRVHVYFEAEFNAARSGKPIISASKVRERTMKATGLSESTLDRILREKESGELRSPAKKRPRQCTKTNIDNFDRDALRRVIFCLYQEGFIPSLDDILVNAKDKLNFAASRSSLWKIMKDIGFKYKQSTASRKCLMERSDISSRRNEFLCTMQDMRLAQRPLIFLDETWVNVNMTKDKMWVVDDEKQDLKVPSGKGSRIIVVHAGSESGFVKNALLVFKSNSTKDYHEEMDSIRFTTWFREQLLPNIPPNAAIIMDNASYHSHVLNKAPISNSSKAEMVQRLKDKEIYYDERLIKPRVYDVVKAHKERFKTYVIDKLAEENGHTVVRLPPYHCEFNPIELIWARVKGYVRKRNTKFTMTHVRNVFEEAISVVSAEDWMKACRHAEGEEKFYWERDQLIDRIRDRIIIAPNSDSADSESSDGETT